MEKKEKYIVSGCLAGLSCRYDGKSKNNEIVCRLIKEGRAIPLCPEQLGGLTTPREPAECRIIDKELRVYTISGEDVTDEFYAGAQQVLEFAKKYNIKKAILQKNSPSCGIKTYDGTFSGTLADYSGITAKTLKDNEIEVISSEDLNKENL